MHIHIFALDNSEDEVGNQLNDMVVAVTQGIIDTSKYEVSRYSPICWQIKPKFSRAASFSIVLNVHANQGKGAFVIIGTERFCLHRSENLSGQSLRRVLQKLSFRPKLTTTA